MEKVTLSELLIKNNELRNQKNDLVNKKKEKEQEKEKIFQKTFLNPFHELINQCLSFSELNDIKEICINVTLQNNDSLNLVVHLKDNSYILSHKKYDCPESTIILDAQKSDFFSSNFDWHYYLWGNVDKLNYYKSILSENAEYILLSIEDKLKEKIQSEIKELENEIEEFEK